MLPGADLVDQGLKDLQAHKETPSALLVQIGRPRLLAAGIRVPKSIQANPEHRLYELLVKDDPDSAHSRYNALIRRLVSFERALGCAR